MEVTISSSNTVKRFLQHAIILSYCRASAPLGALLKQMHERYWVYLKPNPKDFEDGIIPRMVCTDAEASALLRLLRELEKVDQNHWGEGRITGELPRKTVVDLLGIFFKPSSQIMKEVTGSGSTALTMATVSYLDTKFGIKPAMLDSLEMRLSNRRTMVGRARVAINSDRAVIRRILLSRLSPDQYNSAKGIEAKWAVSGGFNAKDVYIEHSDKPNVYQNDFIQHLNDLVDQFTIIKQNTSACGDIVSNPETEVNVMVSLHPHLLHLNV